MRARIGDRLHVHGKTVGRGDRFGEIVEVRGPDGGPPYVVRFEDGHTGLVVPGADAVIERVGGADPAAGRPRRTW
ncbi:DUF1918 domain-containing protein [Embleya scabrispora]|uniref:DUF1918 domain-containing protein n=1 Tax=Embleya scabrispora TaxID=159449 RepID=A0A1T3NVK1_9ACTN|nr:DUF1918 domain-containing protein [Embleya scabrispora]OPC80897.1 DUF1918 domain-containing protein [Embleya scabrispora]